MTSSFLILTSFVALNQHCLQIEHEQIHSTSNAESPAKLNDCIKATSYLHALGPLPEIVVLHLNLCISAFPALVLDLSVDSMSISKVSGKLCFPLTSQEILEMNALSLFTPHHLPILTVCCLILPGLPSDCKSDDCFPPHGALATRASCSWGVPLTSPFRILPPHYVCPLHPPSFGTHSHILFRMRPLLNI